MSSTYLMMLFYPFYPRHCLAIVLVTQPHSLREEASKLREARLSTSPNNKCSSTNQQTVFNHSRAHSFSIQDISYTGCPLPPEVPGLQNSPMSAVTVTFAMTLMSEFMKFAHFSVGAQGREFTRYRAAFGKGEQLPLHRETNGVTGTVRTHLQQ